MVPENKNTLEKEIAEVAENLSSQKAKLISLLEIRFKSNSDYFGVCTECGNAYWRHDPNCLHPMFNFQELLAGMEDDLKFTKFKCPHCR